MEVDRDRAWMLLRVAFSAALLWFVLASVGVGSVVSNLTVLPPSVLALAAALAAFNVALSAYKWQLLLAVKDIDLPFRTLFVYYYVGQFFNAFLPTMVGGDGARIYYLHDNHDAGADAASVARRRPTTPRRPPRRGCRGGSRCGRRHRLPSSEGRR